VARVLALGRLLSSVLTAMALARRLRNQPMVRWLLSGVSAIGTKSGDCVYERERRRGRRKSTNDDSERLGEDADYGSATQG